MDARQSEVRCRHNMIEGQCAVCMPVFHRDDSATDAMIDKLLDKRETRLAAKDKKPNVDSMVYAAVKNKVDEICRKCAVTPESLLKINGRPPVNISRVRKRIIQTLASPPYMLSDRDISGFVGISPKSVNNARHRTVNLPVNKNNHTEMPRLQMEKSVIDKDCKIAIYFEHYAGGEMLHKQLIKLAETEARTPAAQVFVLVRDAIKQKIASSKNINGLMTDE